MAITAGDGAMSANQGKLCFGMVEAVDVGPGASIVAGFAAERCAIGAFASHAIVELALVRIFVARSAVAIFEMERKNLVGAACGTLLVAIRARDGDVRAHQWKSRGFVLSDGECGAMEIDDGVAGFATIVIRSGGKLIVVGILVTIGACLKLNFVDGVFDVFARGNMALGAFHFYVHALERIAGRVMLFHAE